METYFVIIIKNGLDCVFLGRCSRYSAVDPGVRRGDVSHTAESGAGPGQEGGAHPGQAVEGVQGPDPPEGKCVGRVRAQFDMLSCQNNDNCYQLRSSVSPLPTPTSPRSPRPAERDVMEELNMKMTRISQVKERGRTPPVQPSSPVILINGQREERGESSPVKLPFLNEIKQLPRAEPHRPSAVFSPGPSLPQPEPRSTQNSFPFLDDIRKLRKDSTQTNSLEREDRQNTFSQTQNQNIHYGHDGHPESKNIFNKGSNGLEMPAVSSKEIGGAKVKFQNDLLKFNKDSSLSVSPPSKTVRFSGDEGSGMEAEKFSKQVEVDESDDSDLRLGRTQRGKKCSSKLSVKIDDKTNVSKLADNIIPQLNNMQKNFLGLLFFNELSQTIVDDIVAQQVSMMSGSKLSSVLSGLRPEVSESEVVKWICN